MLLAHNVLNGMQLYWEKHDLQFLKPAKTSRGAYTSKPSWLIYLTDKNITGVGEASPLPDLSVEGNKDLRPVLNQLQHLAGENTPFEELLHLTKPYPSVRFALECALLDLQHGGNGILYPSIFTKGEAGIPINGLVWMNSIDEMLAEATQKVQAGFNCLKFKVGALDPDSEVKMVETIRKKHTAFQLQIRLDANGAWSHDDALRLLKEFSRFDIHSLEQPIQSKQPDAMAEVCAKSPIPIALDEELIGVPESDIETLLHKIKPAYIILKPTLIGGFYLCNNWVQAAEKHNIGWWATSALEGNIGLSAIAQWVATKNSPLHQGLGTGLLFENNFPSKTKIIDSKLFYLI